MSYADCCIEFPPTKCIIFPLKILGAKRRSIIHRNRQISKVIIPLLMAFYVMIRANFQKGKT